MKKTTNLAMTLLTVLIISVACNESTRVSAEENLSASSQPEDEAAAIAGYLIEKGDTTWQEVDVMPEFRGGDPGLMDYIVNNVIYPESAKNSGIQGKVIISFTVLTDGGISNATVVQNVDPTIDAEALRVIKSLPAFEKPAIKNGKPVQVKMMIPITFKLE